LNERPHVLARYGEPLAVAAVVVVTVVIIFLARQTGHWWGDDWALYVRQAEGLIHGRVDEVIADNRFTVEMSGLPEFSPPVYPWGFPLVLAPFVAVLGTDLDRLVVAQAVCLGWFLVAWYRLARPRTGPALALLGTIVLALSPQYLRWSELIQSELAFIAVATTALVVLDRQRTRDTMVAAGASLWPLVGVGVAAAAAFTVRREGLAMLPAIGVAQLAVLATWWRTSSKGERGSTDERATVAWWRTIGRLAVPHAVFFGTVAFVQLVLPSTIAPRYEGTGLHNVWGFASDHLGHVLESLGLKDVPSETPAVLGIAWLGTVAAVMLLTALAAGVVRAAWKRPAADLPLVAFLAGAVAIGGSFRFPGSRYLAIVGPIALILAISGAISGARWVLRHLATRGLGDHGVAGRRIAVGAVGVLLALLALGNATRAWDLVTSARDFERSGQVEWGPDFPDSVEMFEAVSILTDDDAVVGFFKARAMTQRTDRRALQVDTAHPIDRVDHLLTHVVLERNDELVIPVEADPDLYDPIWSNRRFTLYRLSN
jgi:hypothetical protein